MNSFEQIRKTLLSVSKEKRNYDRALTEWEYKGNLYDNGEGSATCQLCGQRDIRYEFEISNQKTRKELLVGSECITKFGGIKVYDESGNHVTGRKAKARVAGDKRRLIADAKTRSVINSLVVLANRDKEFDINSFIAYYRERGAFTPKQLALLLWRLESFAVPFKKTHLKVTVRRDREKRQLLSLPDWQFQRIQPCLSSAQRTWLHRNGH